MRYEYFFKHAEWRYFDVAKPIVMCSDCHKWEVIIGSGTICKISGRNIGSCHFYEKKPDDCPLQEVRDDD